MKGICDYRGECFGYIIADKLYDLEDNLAGIIENNAIKALDGTLIWHIDRDGVYDKHWQAVGYIGGARPLAGDQNGDR